MRRICFLVFFVGAALCLSDFIAIGDPASLQKAFEQMQWGRLDEAAGLLNDLLSREPENPTGQFLLAWIEAHQGRHEVALARIEWLTARDPSNYEYLQLELFLRETLGHSMQALGVAQRILELSPGDQRALNARGKLSRIIELVGSGSSSMDKPIPEKPRTADVRADKFDLEKHVKGILETKGYLSDSSITFPDDLSAIAVETVEEKVLLAYLAFRLGRKDRESLRLQLAAMRLPKEFWEVNQLLGAMKASLEKEGVIQRQSVQHSSINPGSSWTDLLSQEVRDLVFQGELTQAWELHMTSAESPHNWDYCAGRLALECWVSSGFESDWLVLASEHLSRSLENPVWQKDSRTLLREIERRLKRN